MKIVVRTKLAVGGGLWARLVEKVNENEEPLTKWLKVKSTEEAMIFARSYIAPAQHAEKYSDNELLNPTFPDPRLTDAKARIAEWRKDRDRDREVQAESEPQRAESWLARFLAKWNEVNHE